MAKFPIYLEMAGRRAVVIGAGSVAVHTVQSLHLNRSQPGIIAFTSMGNIDLTPENWAMCVLVWTVWIT